MTPERTYTLARPVESEPVEPPAPEGWMVTSLGDLAWALECMADAQAEMAENVALADEAIARIRLWLTAKNSSAESRYAYFESQIRLYAEQHKAELLHGKKKSRDLPAGTVGWRKRGGGLVVEDEDAATAWAKAQEDLSLVRVKVELSKSALNDRFKTTGEVPPGCCVEAETETLYVKPTVPEIRLRPVVEPAQLKAAESK